MTQFDDLVAELIRFRDERDWEQFHTPRHLAAALSIESAELLQEFLWKTDSEVVQHAESTEGRTALEEEAADVLIYTFLLCHSLEIDPEKAIRKKLQLNAERYPVDLARSSALKYTELGASQ